MTTDLKEEEALMQEKKWHSCHRINTLCGKQATAAEETRG